MLVTSLRLSANLCLALKYHRYNLFKCCNYSPRVWKVKGWWTSTRLVCKWFSIIHNNVAVEFNHWCSEFLYALYSLLSKVSPWFRFHKLISSYIKLIISRWSSDMTWYYYADHFESDYIPIDIWYFINDVHILKVFFILFIRS